MRCISLQFYIRLQNARMNWFNNEVPQLSALDKQIISHVPQGGNWQNIPVSVPSKRLEQIRKMTEERGVVRTTYYGRLNPAIPSYTISTYYNRPGNGTHIHPVLNRTITSREAARLQSFPDLYHFLGTEGAVRIQIGNAVPPLLAYHLGKQLQDYRHNGTCIDVFCGAGGLSLGLEWAGWDIVTAIDNNSSALATYRANRLSGTEEIIKADLHVMAELEECIASSKKKLDGRRLNLLVGGPPCQGFSHAGLRNHNDIRNNLAATYLKLAEQLAPSVFVLENVEGILSMNKGQVINDLIKSLEELGYTVSKPIWKLNAEEYGVPQMRRRVFLIASLATDFQVRIPSPLFNPCLGRRKTSNILKIDQHLPTPISVGEAFLDLSYNDDQNILRRDYADWINGSKTIDEFVNIHSRTKVQ
jgi:DNA (cytosine-5)-methyltransferase 1